MKTRLAIWMSTLGLLAAAPLFAQTQWVTSRLEDVEFRVRLIQEPEQIEAIVGDDLDKEFMLVELEVKPLYGSKIRFSREDFLLRTRADNDRSFAQSPSRIAGKGVYSVEQRRTSGGGVFGQSNDPLIIGGAPGTGSRPHRVGGPPSTVGSGRAGTSEIVVQQTASEAPETLQDSLARLELPLAETDQDLHGYLYFQLDPKNKLKHLVFYYDGEYGDFQVKFDK